jgi:RNA polymerase sigma-70 factor (ECF subfamily)
MADPFPETRWSMILRLRASSEAQRESALSDLCATYWRPLYAFARGTGQDSHDAEDLVQGFIAQLITRGDLGALGPERGRMRTFFKVAFRHHLISQVRHTGAQRRGGSATHIPLDTESVERELTSHETPEVAYDRLWLRALLARSLERLRGKYTGEKAALFTALEPHLTNDEAPIYAQLAQQLGRTETALRTALHRLREHYREALLTEVADTLAPGESPETELRELLAAC